MKRMIKNMIIILLVIIACLGVALIANNKKQNTVEYESEINSVLEDENRVVKQKYECNEFYVLNVSLENVLLMYFNQYKEDALVNPEKAYNMLDEEYRNKRFGSIDNYKSYLEQMNEKIAISTLVSYRVSEKNDEYTQYICQDSNGNYYIFRERAIMDYSIILDEYTIDLPEFLEKYNKANSIKKCGYNIQKCIEAINNKDYLYVYNKLDSNFKENNYKTENDFIKIIKEKLFDTNKIVNSSYSNEGNTYIYNLTIMDEQDGTKNQNMTIIMQLKEGTDFVMSFSFK